MCIIHIVKPLGPFTLCSQDDQVEHSHCEATWIRWSIHTVQPFGSGGAFTLCSHLDLVEHSHCAATWIMCIIHIVKPLGPFTLCSHLDQVEHSHCAATWIRWSIHTVQPLGLCGVIHLINISRFSVIIFEYNLSSVQLKYD